MTAEERERPTDASGPDLTLLTAALEATEDGLVVVDTDGWIRYCNERFVEILPTTRGFLRGKRVKEASQAALRMFDDGERFVELVERELAAPEISTREEFRLTNGQIVHRISRPIRIDGEITGRVSNLRDVTELREHERRLEQAQRLARTGSWQWEIAADRVRWSDELFEIFGLEREGFEATYQAFLDRVHPEDRDRIEGHVSEALEEGTSYEDVLRISTPDGDLRHVRVFGEAVTDSQGETLLLRGVLQDVTGQEEARRERDRAQRRYRTLFEMSPLALVISLPSGRILDVNRRFEMMLGYGQQEVRGLDATELEVWVNLEDRANVLRQLEEGQLVGDYPTKLRTASGESVEVELTVDELEMGGEQVIAWAIRDVTDRNLYRRELERRALYDELTGLPNRTLLYDRLGQALRVVERDGDDLAVLFVDLDDFKAVNESYGHAVGDRVLAEAAARMDAALRDADVLGRIGGDEFVAVIHSTGESGAERTARRLLDALEAGPFELPDGAANLSTSVGIAVHSDDLDESSALIRAADAAMMRAKASPEGPGFEVYGPEDELGAYRLQRQSRLLEAIEGDELVLYYQPVVDMEAGGAIVGAEALVRWQHPERGLLPPGEFVPFAEQAGMIAELDRWVLREAVCQASEWLDRGGGTDADPGFYLATNVSAPLYQSPDFAGWVSTLLGESGVPASALQLEITEQLSVGKSGAWGRLRDSGVRLAIDDFGTGYSSLQYLRQLEADVLKIDQYFTQDLTEEPSRTSIIVRAVHSIAHQMGMEVIAEGVETEAQRDHLVDLGYRYLQGFLFARPMPATEMDRLLP